MLQDELTKLTLTELEKKDERQDAERVCRCLSYRLTSFWFSFGEANVYFFSASTAWLFFLFFFFLSLSLFFIFFPNPFSLFLRLKVFERYTHYCWYLNALWK